MTVQAGHRTILDVPTLQLGPGAVHLHGPVGAGKTTLLRVAATLQRPAAGRVHVGGHDTITDAVAARRVLGYMGHEPSIPPELPVRATLRLHARMHGVAPGRVDDVADLLGIRPILERPGATLSRGQRALADAARATLHRPRLLLLDEPDTGLDDDGRRRLRRLVQERLDDDALVLVASHRDPPVTATTTVELAEGRPTTEVNR